jgi:hypothetical protein
MDELGISSHEVHMKVDGLGERFISTQSKIASQLELTVRQESSATKEELLELRNAIMPVIMGIQNKLSSLDRAAASRLSDGEKADLVTQLRRELISHPGTFMEISARHPATSFPEQDRGADIWSNILRRGFPGRVAADGVRNGEKIGVTHLPAL